jgi:hypothetical protein
VSARKFPGLEIIKGGGAGRAYLLPIAVPFYNETRQVEIRFENGSRIPKIYVDGSTDSPHRYAERRLCIWYPNDPPEQKWVFKDGLLMLINHIQAHLFREAWWRETGGRNGGEWLGPQVTHGPPKDEVKENGAEPDQPELPRGPAR